MKNTNSFEDIIVPDILPPSDDGVFRSIMIHPDAKPGLIDLLSASMEVKVSEAVVRSGELPLDSYASKREQIDVNCITDAG